MTYGLMFNLELSSPEIGMLLINAALFHQYPCDDLLFINSMTSDL